MKTTPLVSIVVPVYGTEPYLRKCLDSLINQTYRNTEIICVNDESPDNSLQILQQYAQKDPRIKVFSKKNGGLSDSRNFGLNKISGEFFMFIDSDDWLDHNTIEECVNAISHHDADCVMFSYIKEFNSSQSVNHIFDNDMIFEGDELRDGLIRRTFGPVGPELKYPQNCDITVSACMELFRTSAIGDVRFEDNRVLGTFEDGVYQIDIFPKMKKIIYIDKPLYHYRKTNSGSITTKHQKNLPDKWKDLFHLLDQRAKAYALNPEELNQFRYAINNRIAIAILPLGLNEVRASSSLKNKKDNINRILEDEPYKKALNSLVINDMPIHWRVFFYLAKNKLTYPLTLMLSGIEYMRTHMQK
ncbi:MAG: glycosyltransferase family 2 protein [Muribaculaceae bacterium]|nr:glycosyltransferase family 2 protein [Muribaculaceae bacterium]